MIIIGIVATAVDHAAGLQGIDSVEEDFEPQPGIACDGVEVQVGVARGQLTQQGSGVDFFATVGALKVFQQGQAETAQRVSQAEGQTAVAIMAFTACGLSLLRGRGAVRAVLGLVRSGIPDETGLRVAGRGMATELRTAQGVTVATTLSLVFRRAGTRLLGMGGLVASLAHRRTAHL